MRSPMLFAFIFVSVSAWAQFQPESANVNLYFPHLASG
jgi:hypothetical protein